MPHLWKYPGWIGLQQSGLVGDVPTHDWANGTRSFSMSLPAQTILLVHSLVLDGIFGFREATMEKGIVRVEGGEGTEGQEGQ